MIKFIRFIKNLFIGTTILKLFPFLGYKGVVNTQIRIYKKLKRKNYPETVILNKILDSRRIFSLRDLRADDFYRELINIDNKTLEQVIQAIVEWEYLDSFEAHARRRKNDVPLSFVEEFRKEMKIYIDKKTEAL